MTESAVDRYEVTAFNTAKDSENRMHDDTVARRFGFAGGLVPGVEIYAYVTHLPVRHWGRQWLERGTAEIRLLKPVYDGDRVTVSATEIVDGLELRLKAHGELCATGHAALPKAAGPAPAAFATAPTPPDPPANRPPADETTLAVGSWLAIQPFRIGDTEARQYP
ncbi:MAG: hypothetical protein ACREE2_07670, partial [Stellaceae bacterium]